MGRSFYGYGKRLFRQDLLQLGKAGQGILLGQLGLALDQRQHVVDEGLLHAVVSSVDPLQGNLLLGISNVGQAQQLGLVLFPLR